MTAEQKIKGDSFSPMRRTPIFPPDYFPLTMATGIVSLALFHQGWIGFGKALLWLNLFQYLVLWGISLHWWTRHKQEFIPAFSKSLCQGVLLSIVAGTCVLGAQVIQFTNWLAGAELFFWLGVLLWILLIYLFFTLRTTQKIKPPLEKGIRGASLLAVVSTESIAVLGMLLLQFGVVSEGGRGSGILMLSLLCFLIGAWFYAIFIILILYRWLYFRLPPSDMTPDYWINMGALAISTLAGSLLLGATNQWSLLAELRPFLLGMTLSFWGIGTWWIPLLIIVGIWRHLWCRKPLVYGPGYWSMVFPLGMYSVASVSLAGVIDFSLMMELGKTFAYLGASVWGMTFVALARRLAKRKSFSTHQL